MQSAMNSPLHKRPSVAASVAFDLLDPIPLGFFVGALIFDAVYLASPDVMWFKSAAWLIAIGLLFAIVPRFINLARVWFPGKGRSSSGQDKMAFLLYLLGVVAAIVNAFVHSRDAYAVVPEGIWLSILTVAFLFAGNAVLTLQHSNHYDRVQA